MTRPINRPLAKVVKAARKAYEAKRLSAQGPTPHCSYRDSSGRPCVIGAAMRASTAKRLDERTFPGVDTLVDDGVVTTDDVLALTALQRAHDAWAQGGFEAPFVAELEVAERRVAKASGATK